ncbi:putative phosphodiesterase [Nocardioides thalensis]|uniref:Putative phosphodiesterase n=1 Tax=Nocardioides thalensis TaxID=1914755 RepID=A0A853C455_9ACTN|nr:metallophosphoesterase [Nocardioides thalensis]NYJ01786.1 putative phosphodiesterase [Nocardioides thalensis]
MPRPEVHVEPFVHLVDVTHDAALVAWGAFHFRRDHAEQRWEIVDDSELQEGFGRHTCIGHDAEPFGAGVVEVLDAGGGVVARATTEDRTWAWVDGLAADSTYTYRVLVDGAEWAAGERHDWVEDRRGGYDLAPAGRSYDLRFRTFPAPDGPTPPLRFLALGDYGVGIRSDSESSRRQRRVAEVLDRLVAEGDVRFVVSLGDNIYQGEQGAVDDESGGEDDDWYSSFFQPYRYALAQVPFFPVIGNHDTTDTEGSDDRAQMADNFHLAERFQGPGRSRIEPGLFYTVRFGEDLELVGIDTSQDPEEDVSRHFLAERQLAWLRRVFAEPGVRWRIPLSHHPAYCAGPHHEDDADMIDALVPLFDSADVRLVLAGHEHNFQVGRIGKRTYVVSGAGGKVREEAPARLGEPGAEAWAAHAHLLVVDVDGERAELTPVSGLLADGTPHLLTALDADNRVVRPPFTVE